MLPELASSDSAVVMYYTTPGDPRFFKMVKLSKCDSLSGIITDVNGAVIKAKDECVTQGKIYFYGKAGAVETVYFSRLGSCMTFSFIKTGEKYFTAMKSQSTDVLNLLEARAVELPTAKAEN